MATQALFYENVTPVSPQRHGDWSVEVSDHNFASEVNSVPITAVEMVRAAGEFAIVFAGQDDAMTPVVVLGAETNKNHYLNKEGKWTSRYVPAFVRRYPFVFAKTDDGKSFTLCIDENWSGWNQEGKGERLFDDAGERTTYLSNVLKFLEDYQRQSSMTQLFCAKLKELELLQPVQATFKQGDETKSMGGFSAVDRRKLNELPGETLSELAKMNALELIYAHLFSMNNLAEVIEKTGQA